MSSDDKPFSIRTGIIPERAMQTDKLDDETLMRIVNAILAHAGFLHRLQRCLGAHDFFYVAGLTVRKCSLEKSRH